MIENLDQPTPAPVVRFVKHKKTGEIIVLTSPKHFSPQDHEWYNPEETDHEWYNPEETKVEAPKVEAPEAKSDEARFEELKSARVWLHGTEEEKAEYETLKTKLDK